MIKRKVTKNIMRKQSDFILGLSLQQVVFALITIVLGFLTYLFLKARVSYDITMWIVFLEILIIGTLTIGKIQGLPIIKFIVLCFKPNDIRLYHSENDFRINENEKRNTNGGQ